MIILLMYVIFWYCVSICIRLMVYFKLFFVIMFLLLIVLNVVWSEDGNIDEDNVFVVKSRKWVILFGKD